MPPAGGKVYVSITDQSEDRIEEVRSGLKEWGNEEQTIYLKALELSGEAEPALQALWTILEEEPNSLWTAIEEIARQASPAGEHKKSQSRLQFLKGQLFQLSLARELICYKS